MKILTIADFFYPDIVGGSAIMAYEIMRELKRRGHEVTVVTRLQPGLAASEEIDGLQVHRYAMPGKQALYPLGVMRAAKLVKALMARERFDVINMHHASGGVAAGWMRETPSVFVFQGPWYKEAMAKEGLVDEAAAGADAGLALKYRLRRGADKRILRTCTAFITLSDHMRGEALALCPSAEAKHRKIPGGVDIDRFRPPEDKMAVRRELGLPEDKILLLTVRRLATRMGLENLVEAMRTVERERDDVMLLIGGRGEIENQLRSQIEAAGLERTVLTGYIAYDRELPKYYQASDLFLMPSITLEGFGLSTAESLACGTPVLGTPTGGTPEILREEFPDYILPGITPDDLAAGILGKLDEVRDPQTGVRARAYAERHSWRRVTDEFEALLQAAVAG